MLYRALAVMICCWLVNTPLMAAKKTGGVSNSNNNVTTNDSKNTNASNTDISQDPQKNLEDGEKFLAANKKKPGVVTLPSGLQYKEIKAGKGTSPGPNGFVIVNYRGTLLNGKEFDNSEKRKVPAEFELDAVIPGWTEALQLMKPGSEWILYIPPHLAYGKRGVPNVIPPNATLIFNVKLLSTKRSVQENDSEVLTDPVERQ